MPGIEPVIRAFRSLVGICAAAALLVLGAPQPTHAAEIPIAIRDNSFEPQEMRIEAGDTVTWTNRGRLLHNVRSDVSGQFRSPDLRSNQSFSHTFTQEGFYFYHCAFHGRRGQVGMWGVVIVGDPPPPPGYGKDPRAKLIVPDDVATIQGAVDRARPGTTIVVRPGIYREAVVVETPDLVIRGVDRFRTILHGRDGMGTGITVQGADNVRIKNLTVRNYEMAGILFDGTIGYLARRIDSIKNRTFGIVAVRAYNGAIKDSFGYGSGDSAFSVRGCSNCGALVDGVVARRNYVGYSGVDAGGIVVRRSRFAGNGVGILSDASTEAEPSAGGGTLFLDNDVRSNNYTTVPAAGLSESVGLPFGTGFWLAGVVHNEVLGNRIWNHERYGVLVTGGIDRASEPNANRIRANEVSSSSMFDVAWDGAGSNNCFADNVIETSGPPDIEASYHCSLRPFSGSTFEPVQEDVELAIANLEGREEIEPVEPRRPRCQRGKPGCHR